MIPGYYETIAAFLSQYFSQTDGSPIPPDPKYIRGALTVMMQDEGWSKYDIKLEAIRDFNLIIREDLFPAEEW